MANRRRGNGKKNHRECGHVGKGDECRRCLESDRLEGFATKGLPFVTNKKRDKKVHKTWTKQELLAEVERLRGPATPKSQRVRTPTMAPAEESQSE